MNFCHAGARQCRVFLSLKAHQHLRICRNGFNSHKSRASNAQSFQGYDLNQLHTALAKAVAGEKYEEASIIKELIQTRLGYDPSASWQDLHLPHWLGERVAQLGYLLPTDIQTRSCKAFQSNKQCVIQAQTGSGKSLAFLLPLLSRLDYPPDIFPEDLLGPQLIILVPSLELGAQIAMLVYKLFGGNVNSGIPGSAGNMFAYTGPRNLKVRGVLNDEEVLMTEGDSLKAVHVLVAVPKFLAELLKGDRMPFLFHDLRALAVDEVDACFKDHAESIDTVMAALAKRQEGDDPPLLALVGATVSSSFVKQGTTRGWLKDATYVESGDPAQMPQSLLHQYIVAEENRKALVLCRQLRADLEQHGDDTAPPRVIIFANSERQAVKLANPLRTSLWGIHRLAVLLPHGEEPLQMLHAFRDNRATVLLATPTASLGLDVPGVTHVYNLSCPDATSYIHRAGRVGRIGSDAPGVITTIVTPAELNDLKNLTEELHITELKEKKALPEEVSSENDAEGAKKQLEDIYNLMPSEE